MEMPTNKNMMEEGGGNPVVVRYLASVVLALPRDSEQRELFCRVSCPRAH